MIIRTAREEELDRVNELRKQVNDLHVAGKPEVFKKGFPDELKDFIHVIYNDPEQEIIVAESDGTICGFAVLHHIVKGETPFMYERDFLDIDEFCVDAAFRRQGVALRMMTFIRSYAKEKGFHRTASLLKRAARFFFVVILCDKLKVLPDIMMHFPE